MPSSDNGPTEDLADLYENAPCGYVSLSPKSVIVKANRTLADWLGMSPSTLVDRRFYDVLSFGGRIAYETHLAPLLRMQGFVNEIALDLICADGSKIPIIANAAEKRDAQGRHLFTRLTLFKAVDRRTYERGLLEARSRAEEATALERETSVLREQFIAVLGHDLRNPLAALAAGAKFLAQRETLSERGQAVIKEMGGSIARATALVENVLDLARGRLGEGVPVRMEEKPLTPTLEHVVGEIRAVAPDREILTDFQIVEPVTCDHQRIAQLLSNLVSNAVTHGAEGMPIEVQARSSDGHFKLYVTNGGVPIPDHAQKMLFQPFFRGEVRRSRQGLGLGLFIANEIAKAHGGTMSVESNDEHTCFTFTMPQALPSTAVAGRTKGTLHGPSMALRATRHL